MTTIILVCTIILVLIISFLVIKSLIKKKRALQFKLDFSEKQLTQVKKNVKNFKMIIEKLNYQDVYVENLNDKINHASGDDLCLLANSL